MKPSHARILAYLYGDLSEADRIAFETDCERDPELRHLFETERRFQQLYPPQSGPSIPDAALAESRLRLRIALQQTHTSANIFTQWIMRIQRVLTSATSRLAAVPALVLLGVLIGHTWMPPQQATPQEDAEKAEIRGIEIVDFNQKTGQIELSVETLTRQTLKGDFRQPDIQRVLITALQPDQSPGLRLETVDLLQFQADRTQVRNALISALLKDENPGVRIKAVESLKSHVQDTLVRQALRTALLRDPNPGVRVEAIDALQRVPDPATANLFRQHAQSDSNLYIRTQATQTLQEWDHRL